MADEATDKSRNEVEIDLDKYMALIDKLIIWTVLPIFFYLILSPYSILIRIFRKNNFQEIRQSKLSYWQDAESPKEVERYLRQF